MGKRPARTRQAIPKEETKSDRFVRVVTPRVGKAVKAIKVIGYCTGSTYEYTTGQSVEIVNALQAAVKVLCDQFAKKADTQDEFSFKA